MFSQRFVKSQCFPAHTHPMLQCFGIFLLDSRCTKHPEMHPSTFPVFFLPRFVGEDISVVNWKHLFTNEKSFTRSDVGKIEICKTLSCWHVIQVLRLHVKHREANWLLLLRYLPPPRRFRLPYQLAISNMLLPDGINLNPPFVGVAGIIVIFQQL